VAYGAETVFDVDRNWEAAPCITNQPVIRITSTSLQQPVLLLYFITPGSIVPRNDYAERSSSTLYERNVPLGQFLAAVNA